MLGIGFFEIVIIVLVCFIALGPKQIPTAMRTLAGWYRQFTSLRDELRFQIMTADDGKPKETIITPSPHEENPVPKKDDVHG